MANYIAKALKTYLKSPLSMSATSVILRALNDSKGNALAMADFGDFGVVVVKQGDNIEMIKFDGLTVNADGSVTLDVATSGRHIDPTTPYAGSSTGLSFQSGADVIVTNDPLTTAQFAVLGNAQSWTALQTFTVIPVLPASDPTTDNQAVRKAYVDGNFVANTGSETVAGVKTFTSSPIVPTPTTEFQASTKGYVDDNAVFLTGAQTVAGVKTFSSSPIVPTPTTDYQIATKKYVDDVALAGAPDASTTTKGVVEEATEAEVNAGTATGGTGARLYIPAELGGRLPSQDENDAQAGGGYLGTPSTSNKYLTEDGARSLFGNGSDGDVTISTNTTLSADMYYRNLTVNGGVVLNTGGYRIYVLDTFTNNGTIRNNGEDGANGTNAVSIASGGTGGAGGAGAPSGTLAGGANGGAGGDGSDSGGGATNGVNGGNANPSLGGNGTAGATGSSSSCTAGTAGTAGTATGETVKLLNGILQSVNISAGTPAEFFQSLAFYASSSEYALSSSAGSGGGGGSCHFDTGNRSCGGSGGGGGGGGIVYIIARTIVNAGTIEANGGSGGSGGTGFNSGFAGVSGGKGSGGVILLGYETITVGTIQALAGTSGNGTGVAGSIYRVKLTPTIT